MDISEYKKKKKRKSRKAYIDKLKQEHRCITCTKTDERTLAGYTKCEKCAERQRQANKKWYENNDGRQRVNRNRKRLAYGRINVGLCVRCGKNPPEENKAYCTDCLIKNRARYHAQKEKEK